MPRVIKVPTVHVLTTGLLLEYIDHGRLVPHETRPYAKPFVNLRYDAANDCVLYVHDVTKTTMPMASQTMQDKHAWITMGMIVKNMPYCNGIAHAVHNNFVAYHFLSAREMYHILSNEPMARMQLMEKMHGKEACTFEAIADEMLSDEIDTSAKRTRHDPKKDEVARVDELFMRFVNMDMFPPDKADLLCTETLDPSL